MTENDPHVRRQQAALICGVAVAAALAATLFGFASTGGIAAAMMAALLAVALTASAMAYERARAARATLRQQAHLERALADRRAAEDFLRLVADSLPARLSYWDRDNRCRFANRGFCEWHGIGADRILGRRIADLGAPWDRRARANAPRVEAVLAGRTQRFERDDTAPDGQPCVSLAYYVPDWRGDEVVGFIVLATDLSAERRASASSPRRSSAPRPRRRPRAPFSPT
ncbi:PAS domain S-box protein [Piscinibacter aquaticus]|uniref:PAS domain S-box protein n=1 Tax=Piscinibacter aquaticus TaxID=392597 RepID=A0A5C6U1L8_9BURK|nr:PAS domain S-box protein [Piscinibacter aquaticus]